MKKVFNLYNIFLVLILGLISVLTLKTTEVKAAGTVNWPNGSTVTISRTVENVYNAPEVEFTYKIVTAVFDGGTRVNAKMKNLANNTTTKTSLSADTEIQAIKRGSALPNGFTPTDANTVSAETSDYPIYIWWDSSTHTIYYYSEADKVFLNSGNTGGTYFCNKLQSLTDISGLSGIDASTATNMGSMFQNCSSLTDISALSNWDVSNVTYMGSMFVNCSSLTSINPLNNWDTSNVESMGQMFQGCTGITNINALSNWDTSNVTNMSYMFRDCSNLANINGASNWDTSRMDTMYYMFINCSKASGTIQILNNLTSYGSMFEGAATESGAQITVNYSSNVTSIDNIIATKSSNSNVVKGSVVSIPQGSGSGSGSSSTAVDEATITFNGSETVSNSYTVTKSTTLDLSTAGLKFRSPGDYEITVKEIATSDSAYPVDNDNEYTVIVQVTNVTDQNGTPTGNFNAKFVIKDDNDTKVSNMPFNEPKDETKFGHIELTKTVKGIMADRTKDFSFSVQVDDAASNACQSYSLGEKYLIKGTGVPEDGSEVTKCKSGTKDSITLNHGETATIGQFTYNNNTYDSISIDDYYKIIEGTESDYTTTFKINSGSTASGRDTGSNAITHSGNIVTFYNQREGSPVTGLFLTILPYLLLIGIGTGGLILFKKKKEKTEVI